MAWLRNAMRAAARWARRALAVRDEAGFTTVGMAVSLLICLALIFTSAQVYRVSSASAEIQEVADAAALAAQNEVAEYLIAVRTCDALVLSMTLLGAVSYGAGIAALCVPAAEGMAMQLIELGDKAFEARDRFAQEAAAGLNALQEALPFLAAVRAAAVASANDESGMGGDYFAVAVLVPLEGEEVSLGDGSAASRELAATVEAGQVDLARASAEAQEAMADALAAKERAFEADCGSNPEYCMYERASSLANLSAAENPLYQSVDAWSFSVALERARTYYAARLEQEAPMYQRSDVMAASAIRKAFYAYAVAELEGAYVHEDEDSFEAYFPELFSNADELCETSLYVDRIWPVSAGAAGSVMHAWDGCAGIAGPVAYGSLQEMEEGAYPTCSICGFTVGSVGSVAAASTSIPNGFEHHYDIVAQAAKEYQKACEQASPYLSEAKSLASGMFDALAEVMAGLGNVRISAVPPGSMGVVAFAVNADVSAAEEGFESRFVADAGALGVRAAVAGATMIEDPSGEGGSVIASLLDGFAADGSAPTGAARVVLGCWSSLLASYGAGQESLVAATEGALDSIPLAGASGLGGWAAERLRDAVGAAGLQPADLDALKAVSVNTLQVVSADDGEFARSFGVVKERALGMSSSTSSAFSMLLSGARSSLYCQIDTLEEGFEVARVELPVGNVEVPVTIALPQSAGQAARSAVDESLAALAAAYAEAARERVWQ